MSFMKTLSLSALLAGATALGNAQLKDTTVVTSSNNASPIEYTIEMNRLSTWYMRGLKFSEGSVDQLISAATCSGVTGKALLNYEDGKEKITEVDLLGLYSFKPTESTSVMAGYIHEFLPNTGLVESQEAFISGIYESFVNVIGTFAIDWNKGNGQYYGFDVNKTLDFNKFPITLAAGTGYNQHYWTEGKGWSHVELSARISVLAGNFTFTPSLSHTFPLNEKHNIKKDTFLGLNAKIVL